jgi:hypothetical protein
MRHLLDQPSRLSATRLRRAADAGKPFNRTTDGGEQQFDRLVTVEKRYRLFQGTG